MVFRRAKPQEILELFWEGYKVWSRNRTFEQYSADNGKEDAYGTRYVIEENGELVSSLILLKLKDLSRKRIYGIGSVLTPLVHKKKGYASELLKNCLEQVDSSNAIIFLYSEVAPAFYERFHFRVLPPRLQKDTGSICMALCTDEIWEQLLKHGIDAIPDHF